MDQKVFFICIKGAAVCTVCDKTISVLKGYNIETLYETQHASHLSSMQGQLRRDKITHLKNCLCQKEILV
jgi:hypothetical protein